MHRGGRFQNKRIPVFFSRLSTFFLKIVLILGSIISKLCPLEATSVKDGTGEARQLIADGFTCSLSEAIASFSIDHEERSFQRCFDYDRIITFSMYTCTLFFLLDLPFKGKFSMISNPYQSWGNHQTRGGATRTATSSLVESSSTIGGMESFGHGICYLICGAKKLIIAIFFFGLMIPKKRYNRNALTTGCTFLIWIFSRNWASLLCKLQFL